MINLKIIVAMARNNGIGRKGALPWSIKEDMKHFSKMTKGKGNNAVVMGRKTWESIGSKPLPYRTNIVVTRQQDLKADGALVVYSLSQAIGLAPESDDELFIAGGADVYRQAMAVADTIYLTLVDAEPEGDTFFPQILSEEFKLISREDHPADDRHAMAYSFLEYERIY